MNKKSANQPKKSSVIVPRALECPRCPYLPEPLPRMDWKHLGAHRGRPGAALYLAALRYAHYLWLRGLAARGLLAAERALFCPLPEDAQVLKQWPLPYLAIAWMIRYHSGNTFIGNPRVHYQHLADRVRGEGWRIKSQRAWACWYLVREIAPDLCPDPLHAVTPPALEAVCTGLACHGLAGERAYFEESLAAVRQWGVVTPPGKG